MRPLEVGAQDKLLIAEPERPKIYSAFEGLIDALVVSTPATFWRMIEAHRYGLRRANRYHSDACRETPIHGVGGGFEFAEGDVWISYPIGPRWEGFFYLDEAGTRLWSPQRFCGVPLGQDYGWLAWNPSRMRVTRGQPVWAEE